MEKNLDILKTHKWRKYDMENFIHTIIHVVM